jgi:hypothetical protein
VTARACLAARLVVLAGVACLHAACDARTNEPCAQGETCKLGKVGHGPVTVTAECEK